jgi:uncharacterized protein YjbI with pentapeptide repeats
VAGAVVAVAVTLAIGIALGTNTRAEVPARIDVLKTALAVVAGVGGAVALVVAYRRQRDLEQGRFVERFGAAAAQLGDTDAAVRIAGVYAMAGVADESRDSARRQQCIDVLCGYIRLPYDPNQGSNDRSEVVTTTRQPGPEPITSVEQEVHQRLRQNDREVRQTVVRIIAAHLQNSAEISWSPRDFDFTGVLFEDANFDGAVFGGERTFFERATFSGGNTSFECATFNGRHTSFDGVVFRSNMTRFSQAAFSGKRSSFFQTIFNSKLTDFGRATFSCDNTNFWETEFSGEHTTFAQTTFSGDAVFWGTAFKSKLTDFRLATFSGEQTSFDQAAFSGERITFDRARFCGKHTSFGRGATFGGKHTSFKEAAFGGGDTSFTRAIFSGGTTAFDQAIFESGITSFERATFSGGATTFGQAKFGGDTTSFERAIFSGDTTSFERAIFSGGATTFGQATFDGGATTFEQATFNGKYISFEQPRAWENISFDWARASSSAAGRVGDAVSAMPRCIHPREWPPPKWRSPEEPWPSMTAVRQLNEAVEGVNERFEDSQEMQKLLSGLKDASQEPSSARARSRRCRKRQVTTDRD